MKYFLVLFLFLSPKTLLAKTLATYQNIAVTQEEAEFKAKTLNIQNYFSLPEESQNKIITEIIKEKLIEEEAKRQNLHKKIEYEAITRNILVNNYIMQNYPNIESEVNSLYVKMKADLAGKKVYNFHHILFKTEEDAKKAHKEILAGKSNWKQKFSQIASSQSLDTPTAKTGGHVGKVLETFLPKDLSSELAKLKPNTLSGVIKTNLGYHLCFVENVEDVKIPQLSEVQASLVNQVLMKKKEEIASTLINEQKIKFN